MNEREKTWQKRVEAVEPRLAKKRFHLSKESFAKERIKKVREEFDRLRERYPFVLSFHLYGSLSKGYAVHESDIDGILFLEPEGIMIYPRDAVIEKVKEDFENQIGRISGAKDERDRHLVAHTISHRTIENAIAFVTAAFAQIQKTAPADFSQMDAHWHTNQLSKTERENFIQLMDMFTGIVIGNGIYEYRRQALEKLKEAGEIGERIWSAIIDSVRLSERPVIKDKPSFADYEMLEGKYEDLYPQTIDEAIKYFVERKPFRSAGTDK